MQSVARLIKTFIPNNYALSLNLDRIGRTFDGIVTIQGAIPTNVDDIRLHAKDLSIESVTFDGKAADFSLKENDELSISHKDIAIGEHIIVVSFSGAITDPMHGLYPCYFEVDGVKKELLATQFESHHAREVFPCIDEPEAKATFDVTLTTEPDVTVLGNMPVALQRNEDGKLVTTFETSPRMSSYLLAFVIGELHKKSATTKGGVEVNVWATPAQSSASLDFAVDIATRTIDFFDSYFGTPYPLTKSDHVALPDFSSGAMENWGLITYREVALLADPETSSLSNKRQAATVIAHELSHQWFGNLVTMKWWNDLWLNESFANMMEYLSIDALQPDWEIWLDHASYEVLQALRRDSLDGVQSIRSDVHHPDEIGALFDPSIVYAKGGRLLRMLQTYIGNVNFQKGLKLYFEKYAYQNTEANDLWECLSEASGQDIGLFMNTWISQSGYPVVSVTKDGNTVQLSQKQFFIGPHGESEKLWPIPLNANDPLLPRILSEKELTVAYNADEILQLNMGGTAHFITHYSDDLMADIIGNLDRLSDVDRLHLLHEQTLLAQAGIISTADLIPLLRMYKDESVEAVWDIMSVALNELKRFIETDEAAEKKLRAFVGELGNTQFERLGWEEKQGEPGSDTKFRGLIISQMIYSERPDILKKAQELFSEGKLDPELRTSIMAAAVRYASNDDIIDQLLDEHQKTSNSELQEDIAAALTATKKAEIIDRLIALLQDQTVVRMQDFPRWFVWLMRNRYGRDKMWQWTQDNWPWMLEKFKGDSHFDAIPRYIASSLVTQKQLDEYTEFFEESRKEPALKRNIEIGIGELKGRIELIARDGDAVRKALLDL
ncbi:MAG: aminopeptidase nonfunctional [Candidatus Saccharibacteria bacterium]|nr:aminopeptidase nonfunctional [Candidatus Saccharibacteria bacterium]